MKAGTAPSPNLRTPTGTTRDILRYRPSRDIRMANKTPAKQGYGPRRRPGRPTKLTYEMGDQIIALIKQGVYVEVAARSCGVPDSRFRDWAARAADWDDATEDELEALDDEMAMFAWFRTAYKRAEAEAEASLLLKVQRAQPQWQAHMTILERRFPPRWRRREEVEHSGGLKVESVPSAEEERSELDRMAGVYAAPKAIAEGPDAIDAPVDA